MNERLFEVSWTGVQFPTSPPIQAPFNMGASFLKSVIILIMNPPNVNPIDKNTQFNPEELEVAKKLGIKTPLELKRFLGENFCGYIILNLNVQQLINHSRSMFEKLVKELESFSDITEEFSKLTSLYHLYKVLDFGVFNNEIMVLGQPVVPFGPHGVVVPLTDVVIMAKLDKKMIVPDKTLIETITQKINNFHEIVKNGAKELNINKNNINLEDETEILEVPEELGENNILEMMDREFLKNKSLPEDSVYIPKKMRDASVSSDKLTKEDEKVSKFLTTKIKIKIISRKN